MKDDRKRDAVKDDYTHALGLAAFSLASCEWQAVWCCEKIRPGSLRKMVRGEMTAGQIAKYFIDVTRNMPKSTEREELNVAAQIFANIVPVRNSIMHGKPCTGPNGESRLRAERVLEIPDLEDAADSFAACAIELNRLFYAYLARDDEP